MVHLSQTEAGAGAGRAAYRIHCALQRLNVNSRMLVGQKRSSDSTVMGLSKGILGRFRARCCEYLEARWAKMLALNPSTYISLAKFNWCNPSAEKVVRAADLVALYWINGAFISPEALAKINKPLIWRLSDVWPFTGGCHYPGDCIHFESSCGVCPQLSISDPKDATYKLWMRKASAWKKLNLTVVAPSRWMASLARRSSLFSGRTIEVIPTGVDLHTYCPVDKDGARRSCSLPKDSHIIMFGAISSADDFRKGFRYLQQALGIVAQSSFGSKTVAVIFGRNDFYENMPIQVISLGKLETDESLAAAYNSADIVVVPSLEDNLPNVALESIACGTPVVGFNVCGMPEIVKDGWNGRLVKKGDSQALGHALVEMLSNQEELKIMRENARTHAERYYSLDRQAKAYLDLYKKILSE